jgi:osmotically-inducible protein OsmY
MNRVSSFVAVAGLMLLGSSAMAQSSPSEQPVGDSQISDQVVAALRRTDASLVRRLEVSTKDGVVTLSGHATSVQAAMKAVQTARNVPGVTKVRNQLSMTQ